MYKKTLFAILVLTTTPQVHAGAWASVSMAEARRAAIAREEAKVITLEDYKGREKFCKEQGGKPEPLIQEVSEKTLVTGTICNYNGATFYIQDQREQK